MMSNCPFQSVLCPVDFSEGSARALETAAKLAALGDAKLVLLHAAHVEVPSYMTEGSANEIRRQLAAVREEAARKLNEWAAPYLAGGVTAEVVIDERPAVEAIHAQAAKLPQPWIVMGTHGRTGLQRLLLGSVTERTLRESRVPVVTIPPPAAS
jgi:nucleotide-binding universal stress UspA family protein